MRWIGDEQQLFLQYGNRLEIRCRHRQRDESQIRRTGSQERDRAFAAADGDLEVEVRVCAPDLREKRREHVQAYGHSTDEPDRPAQRFARVADRRYGVLQILKDTVAETEQRFTGRRDSDAPAN